MLSLNLLFTLIFSAYLASAVSVSSQNPQLNAELFNEVTRNGANYEYLLYTRRNPEVSQMLVMSDSTSILSSNFNGRVPTVVIIHGWFSKHEATFYPTVRDAFLGSSDVNVIILDWRQIASGTYVSATQSVPAIGRALGDFLAYLNRVAGAQFESYHLVGLGLGAHLAGVAGRRLGGRASRITALDPAGPSWTSNPERINPTDAIYVEAIHTDGGIGGFGIGSAVANADFFPNGGWSQPGCSTNRCNHNRAWELFASTVTNNHLLGRECTTTLQFYLNSCRGQQLNMGNNILIKSGAGTYRLDTASNYPY